MYTQNVKKPLSGYQEIDHTADWALSIWAPTLAELFELAVKGMYELSATNFATGTSVECQLDLEALDQETLLVAFLSEVLYLNEDEGIGIYDVKVNIDDTKLRASFYTAPIIAQDKEIKAVTFHDMKIISGARGYEVTVVFDV